MPPKTPAKKTDEEQESDVEVIPNLRKSARIASKSEHRDARGESVSSITASESSVVTPARAAGKKRGSVEPEASAPVTPSRRTSARLSSMSEHNENGDKPLELPTPRKRTSSTSSMGSTTTPRRMTRAASKTMPTLLENEEDVPKTPPQEEISKALLPEVPQSAQKRHANLASKLIKMLDTPQKTKKPMLDIAEDEEVIVLPETKKDETLSKISPNEESPSKTTKKDSPKKESPKKEQESPKKEKESPKKEQESPKKETPKKVSEISKKESAKKETPKKETPKSNKKKDDDEESEDEAMDWEEGPIKTPVVFHPTVLPMSKKRLQQLLPEQTETPTRAARRGRPSSAVIFGEEIEKKENDEEVVDLTDSPVREKSPVVTAERVEKVSPVKKAVSPTKSPVKVVEENKEDEEDEEMGSDDVFLPESPAKKTTVSPVKEKVPSPVKKAASPKKTVKAVEVDDEEEEEDVEQEDEEQASDEEEEDVGEDDEEEEEEEEQKEVTKSPKKKLVVEEDKEKKEEDMEDEDEEVEDEDVNDEEEDEEEEEEDEDEAVDGMFPAVSFNKVYNGSVDFSAALESVYAWAFARGSSRVDDLPGKLVAAGEAETVWQQIDHRNAQITKDCKKAKKAGLLEKDIELAEEEKQSGKKAKGKKRRPVEEEEQEEEDEAMFDDEDLLMDEDEEEEGEDVDDEDEEEGNLFDMTADELARLDEDLKALEAEAGEEEEEEEERPKKKKKKTAEGEKKKKFPKSSVDDRFFSLAEMEAAADALEKDGAIEEGILDDDEEGDAAYTYDEFFGGADDDDVFGGKKEKKKGKKTAKRDDEEEDDVIGKKASSKGEKRKSVSWAEGDKLKEERLIEPTGKMRRLTAAALNGEEEDEEEQAKEKPEEEEERILLGPAEDEDKEDKTQLKVSIKSIKKRIAQLEEENLEARKWDLQGEVGGSQRGENTLLEQHVEFDHGMTRAPTITEDFNAKIEAIVLQRFKDKAWDDPVRTVRQEERTDEYRNKLVDEDLLIKQSLSSVYEKEYEKAQEGADASAAGKTVVDPKHAEIDGMWTELCGLIDPLFHFNVTPQQAKAEVKVLTNVRALQSEEVGAMMSTEEMLIAPEEVKRREKGALKGKEERDSTDKKRERRKKKQKQRAVVLTRGEDGLKRMLEKKAEGETDENGEPKKKKKKKAGDGASAASAAGKNSGGKFKSTDFFTKLQTTVQNELVEKTKKAKVKAVSKGNSSAKFKL